MEQDLRSGLKQGGNSTAAQKESCVKAGIKTNAEEWLEMMRFKKKKKKSLCQTSGANNFANEL